MHHDTTKKPTTAATQDICGDCGNPIAQDDRVVELVRDRFHMACYQRPWVPEHLERHESPDAAP